MNKTEEKTERALLLYDIAKAMTANTFGWFYGSDAGNRLHLLTELTSDNPNLNLTNRMLIVKELKQGNPGLWARLIPYLKPTCLAVKNA